MTFPAPSPGEEARKLFSDAQALLKEMVATGSLQCHGVVGFYRAERRGDDILVYGEDGEQLEVLYGIRQQVSLKMFV